MEADVGWVVVGGDEEVPPRRARREVEERVRGGAGPGRCGPGWAGGWGSGRAPAGPAGEEKAGAVEVRALGRAAGTDVVRAARRFGCGRAPAAHTLRLQRCGRGGALRTLGAAAGLSESAAAPTVLPGTGEEKPGRAWRRARAGRERKGWDGKRREEKD